MASKAAEAQRRERERRELMDRLFSLEAKVDRLVRQLESGAVKSAPAKRPRKTTQQEAQTS